MANPGKRQQQAAGRAAWGGQAGRQRRQPSAVPTLRAGHHDGLHIGVALRLTRVVEEGREHCKRRGDGPRQTPLGAAGQCRKPLRLACRVQRVDRWILQRDDRDAITAQGQ